jgi:hypothetical protein
MENEFVTYEQALALKELGFDRTCLASYADKIFYLATHRNNLSNKTFIAAPLKQQVFRWFREKYEIHGFIIHYSRVMFRWCIDSGDYFEESIKLDTYEEAENACIDKLIEIAKQKEI